MLTVSGGVTVVVDWQGDGRMTWQRPEGSETIRSFTFPPTLAVNLVRSTESVSTSEKPMVRAIAALSAGFGQAIAEALAEVPEPRV
ncbi:MAG TPA: hypothetical protein VME20_12955 [Acidimicrobiales bacterium]|nr:hypothetical protein [Acidimicrobiales bacterium]